MKNIYSACLATLKNLKKDGRLGAVQTVSVTVNGKAQNARRDIAALISFVEAVPTDIRYVVSAKPYAHGSLTIFFENEVLARYMITDSPAAQKTDWHVYSDKTELYSRAEEGIAKIIPADLFPNTETVEFAPSDELHVCELPAEAEKFCRELCGYSPVNRR